MKLAVVTNILTPYRLPLFEHFAKSTKDCTVFLQAEREENRAWRLPPVTFRIDVLPGFHLRLSGAEVSIHLIMGFCDACGVYNQTLSSAEALRSRM